MEKLLKIIAVNVGGLVFGTLLLILFLLSLSSGASLVTWIWLFLFLALLTGWIAADVRLLRPEPARVYEAGELTTLEQYQEALEKMNPKCFKKQIEEAEKQLLRLEQKQKLAATQLQQYFGGSTISMSKYTRTVDGVVQIYLENLKKMINRIALFDYEGYKKLLDGNMEHTAAFIPYQESIDYIDRQISDNEKILSSLDHLLLEISKLNDSSIPLEDSSAMEEMQELISNTKLYKH